MGFLCPKCKRWHETPGDLEEHVDTMHSSRRPSRTETYMEICHVLRKRSTCLRGKVGALLVMDKRIIATGYNGSPPGAPHCFELGCDVESNDHQAGCQRTIHAEANVIAYAARHGAACEGANLYSTHGPCLKCAQLIAAAGISSVVYEVPYRLPDGLELLDTLSIPVHRFELPKSDMQTFAEAKGWGSDEEHWVDVER
jgi:dCMP deaminase